jgi:hypothetical protein
MHKADQTYIVSMSFFEGTSLENENDTLFKLGLENKKVLYFGSPVRPVFRHKHIETLLDSPISEKISIDKDRIINSMTFTPFKVNVFGKHVELKSPALLFEEEVDRYLDNMLFSYHVLDSISKKSEKIIFIFQEGCKYQKYFQLLSSVFLNISFLKYDSHSSNKINYRKNLLKKTRSFFRICYKFTWFVLLNEKIIIGSTGRDLPEYLGEQFDNIHNNRIALNDCLYISRLFYFFNKLVIRNAEKKLILKKGIFSINRQNVDILAEKIILKGIETEYEEFICSISPIVNNAILITKYLSKNTLLVTHHHDGLNGILSEVMTKIGLDSHLVPHGSFITRDLGYLHRSWNRYAIIFGMIPCTHIGVRSTIVSDYYSNLISLNEIHNVKIVLFKRRSLKRYTNNNINILHASTPKSSYRHRRSFLYESVSNYFDNLVSIAGLVEADNEIESFIVMARRINSSDLIVEDIINVLKQYKKTKVLIDENFLDIVGDCNVVISYSSSIIEETLSLEKKSILYYKFGGYNYNKGSKLSHKHEQLLYSCDTDAQLLEICK